jgi:hypothetical protein
VDTPRATIPSLSANASRETLSFNSPEANTVSESIMN